MLLHHVICLSFLGNLINRLLCLLWNKIRDTEWPSKTTLDQNSATDSPRGHSQRTSSWPRGRGVCGIRTFNCYSNVILLFYPDVRGEGGLEILVLAGRPLWMAPNGLNIFYFSRLVVGSTFFVKMSPKIVMLDYQAWYFSIQLSYTSFTYI